MLQKLCICKARKISIFSWVCYLFLLFPSFYYLYWHIRQSLKVVVVLVSAAAGFWAHYNIVIPILTYLLTYLLICMTYPESQWNKNISQDLDKQLDLTISNIVTLVFGLPCIISDKIIVHWVHIADSLVLVITFPWDTARLRVSIQNLRAA